MLKYFLKILPRSDLKTRKMIEELGMFKKEAQIYAVLLPKMKNQLNDFDVDSKWRPHCYLSRDDCIVMEELDTSYKHLPDRMEFDSIHVIELLKTVAKMHASCIEFEKVQLEGTPLDKDYAHLLKETPLDENNCWFKAGLELIYFIASKYLDSFSKKFNIPPKDDFMKLLNKIYVFRDDNPEFENVLCHRDLWTKNILFRFPADSEDYQTPEHCLVLDFQICRYHPPAVDVLLAIYFNTRRDLRRQELDNWTNFYLDYVKEYLKKLDFPQSQLEKLRFLGKAEFEKSCEHFQLMPLVMNCIFVPLTHLEPGTLPTMQREEPGKYFELCNVSRNDFVAENMERDQYYREYVLEVVEELVEYLLK